MRVNWFLTLENLKSRGRIDDVFYNGPPIYLLIFPVVSERFALSKYRIEKIITGNLEAQIVFAVPECRFEAFERKRLYSGNLYYLKWN